MAFVSAYPSKIQDGLMFVLGMSVSLCMYVAILVTLKNEIEVYVKHWIT